jgi:cysteine-S-conjugate beta-lyase
MIWNFDEVPAREKTDSIKYDLRKETFGNSEVIPLWVADMDFKTPDFITDALSSRLNHGIFGYSFRPERYFTSIINWTKSRHQWDIQKEWICFSPGIVPALNFCTLAFTQPGDSIIVQPPVYFPFFSAVEAHGRKLIFNQLRESDGSWEMDFDNLKLAARENPRMIFISNPHNPVGRAWSREELKELSDICLKNNIIIVSDEIHCDLVMPPYKHTPMATVSGETEALTVTCISASKTFNLAGLYTSSVIISDKNLRKSFNEITGKLHIGGGNIFGTEASVAAFTYGEEWLEQLVRYINANAAYVTDYCRTFIPEIKPAPMEATYLLWLDCRKLGMTGKQLQSFFVEKAGIGMNEGSTFGPGGEGYMRMNIGCPRSTIVKAMQQTEAALSSIR